jgi:outer membrane receptor protein involved in Fe transport
LRDEIASSKLNGILDSASRGEPYTFDTRLQTLVLNGISALQAKDGTASPELRKWRANLVSDYEFSTGLLKDFSVGGALRWQSAIAIGYPELSVISGAVTSDIKHPYYGKAELNGDMWVGYSARWKNNYIWKVQLNVRNLVGERGYIPVVANPDGRIAIVRNPDPMEFSLRYTLYF